MTPILLNTETARLGGLKLKDGGRLVFDPNADLAKLTSEYVLIEDMGSMAIGSEECKFQGNAEILLTGTGLCLCVHFSTMRSRTDPNLHVMRKWHGKA